MKTNNVFPVIGLLLGSILSGIPSLACASGRSVLRLDVDGVSREALVFEPSAQSGGKPPLVLVFHGHGGDMRMSARAWGMHLAWPEAVVAYMQGLPTAVPVLDPDGKDTGWQSDANQNGGRDLKFVDAVVARLRADLGVNEKRVFAMGFSNGGSFSFLLWSERPALFAAFGIAAGRTHASDHLTQPKPFIQIAGRADQVMPFSEQERSFETARAADSAGSRPESCGEGCSLYSSNPSAPVEWIVHDGGHVLPPHPGRVLAAFFRQLKL